MVPFSIKKRLNVDSPSFTPTAVASLAVNGAARKPLGLSPKAASAAPFKPKGLTTSMRSLLETRNCKTDQ